ncbi:WAT1-related protein [Apostasia shenzhenica]|uniref:WAT1-related protein n=1 Tax=Apostasia shenzhenica TaxID=1088818 RepID=A0A2I0A0R7_9ASPA|nr:WAT1-related protein [Apostasia shenzhenica]
MFLTKAGSLSKKKKLRQVGQGWAFQRPVGMGSILKPNASMEWIVVWAIGWATGLAILPTTTQLLSQKVDGHMWMMDIDNGCEELSLLLEKSNVFVSSLSFTCYIRGAVEPVLLRTSFGYAGMYIISIVFLKKGISHFVLVVYRNAVAAAAIAPFALWPVLDQNLYYMGTTLTSASFTAALVNILPAVTFLMASFLRIEKISINSRRSQSKIVGTLVTVIGALLMILYKGLVVGLPWTKGRKNNTTEAVVLDEKHWIISTFMLLGSCICWSAFFIVQANTLKSYPAELSVATLICFMGMVESAVVALVMERGGVKPWLIGCDMRLFSAVYSGVVCSGVSYCIQGVIMKERGPVFVTAFQPLCMIIVAILGSIILAEQITLGR